MVFKQALNAIAIQALLFVGASDLTLSKEETFLNESLLAHP